MNDHGQWQLRGGAPELYERYLVPAITALWATDLIERAAPRPGERVLDLACGTGIVARLAAARMGAGRIVGIDINSGMLAVARSLPAETTPPIEWQEGSALALPFPDEAFDAMVAGRVHHVFPGHPGRRDCSAPGAATNRLRSRRRAGSQQEGGRGSAARGRGSYHSTCEAIEALANSGRNQRKRMVSQLSRTRARAHAGAAHQPVRLWILPSKRGASRAAGAV